MPRTSRPNPYHPVFVAHLNGLPIGQRIDYRQLLTLPGLPKASDDTKRRHLRTLVGQQPALLQKLSGFYPSPDTVIDLVEHQYGPVLEVNLDCSNQYCRSIVLDIAEPVLQDFVRDSLSGHISGCTVSLTIDELMKFLIDDYDEFSKGAENGLVSIAGSINERLLTRAMKNAGLREGNDFKRTGKNSEGDLIVHSHSGNRDNLGIEVKSYAARERLLRGLRDIQGLKVGVGYFKDPAEFNYARTVTLLQADPAAIYMPSSTLNVVDPQAQGATTHVRVAHGSRLYRPLEQFVTDMRHFTQSGLLPKY